MGFVTVVPGARWTELEMMKRAARKFVVAVVLMVSTLTVALGRHDTAGAVCHDSSEFWITTSIVTGTRGAERPKVGVCNNNGSYQYQLRSLDGDCVMTQFETSVALVTSVCVTTSTWTTGPSFIDSGRVAPLYLCTSNEIVPHCWSGPWTNRGF